jgi:hypothetical protein
MIYTYTEQQLLTLDKDRVLLEKQAQIEANKYIHQLKNTNLGQCMKSEILLPKKIKKNRFYKLKQSINKFFKLFG